MSLLYLIGPDARLDFCRKLVDKLCRIPPRYRNDATLIADLHDLFGTLDWVHWDRMLRAAIAHDHMVQTKTWADNDEERWLKSQLHPVCRNGFTTIEQIDNIYFNNDLEKVLQKAADILGYNLCDEFFDSHHINEKHGEQDILAEMQEYSSQTVLRP